MAYFKVFKLFFQITCTDLISFFFFKIALIVAALVAIIYAQQPTNHDLELTETRMKKPQSYGDSGHYGGGGYGSSGGKLLYLNYFCL